MNLEGRLIGNRYEIIEKIGSGGMATVYKAKCHVLNRYVAVKILRDEYTTDSEFIRRFNTEAQSAASLAHPNIVSIYDVGNEGNLYYIVMELIQGKTLKEIIVEDGSLPWKWAVNVAIQIASALEVAHKNNIIHRDIKPHNIIITEEGIAKVTDFGIAKAVSNSTITAFGTTIGSVHYFSPEHARGGFTDAKSDLYSLGVVMYEMITGKVPFDADTPVSVALKHMQETPKEPNKIKPNLPISVNNIIMKALEKDVSLRYQSATEMLKDLTLALKKPDEDFVKRTDVAKDFPTQRVPIINSISNEENKKEEENNTSKFWGEHKKLKIGVIVGGILVLIIAAIATTYFAFNSNRLKDVQIVNLVNKTEAEAREEVAKINVYLEVIGEEYNNEVPAGQIISQEPKYRENYTIKEQSTIKVVISKGEELTKVPKITGKTKEDAEAEIQTANLKVELVNTTSEEVEAGIVIRQEPEAGSEVKVDSIVKVYVSIGTGKKQVTVPVLTGKTEEAAKSLATSVGLTITDVKYETDTTKTNGIVLQQDIEAGKVVDENTGVIITVNKIPEIVSGTVHINVKSIERYTESVDDEGNPIEPKEVKLKVLVNDEQVEERNVSQASENESVTIQGIGTVTVKVYIDGNLRRTEQIDLNTVKEKTIE